MGEKRNTNRILCGRKYLNCEKRERITKANTL